MPPNYQAYLDLGIPPWTSQAGPLLPQSVTADYGEGVLEKVHYGAFLGWCENYRWWIEIGRHLSPGLLGKIGLVDVEHQAGGHSCIAWLCVGLPVKISSDMLGFAAELVRDHYHALGGHLDGNRGDAHDAESRLAYRKRLASVGLSADLDLTISGYRFMESVYPIDATDRNLKRFLAQPGQALGALGPVLAVEGAREKLAMFLLAENSD